jgi:zinc transport system substrate-binding protein
MVVVFKTNGRHDALLIFHLICYNIEVSKRDVILLHVEKGNKMRLAGIFAIWAGLTAQATASELKVAVDIAPVYSIVAQVMGDTGTPDLIVPVGASPHDYAMRPSEARLLSKADIVVWVGEGLTPWLHDPITTLAPNARQIELLELEETTILAFREGETFGAHSHGGHEEEGEHEEDEHEEGGHEEGEHEDEHGDHESGDPHVWLDPLNAIAWATYIADVLGKADAANAQVYNDNAERFIARISALSLDMEKQIEPVKGGSYIVYHDAFHGFEHRFDIEAKGAISDSDAKAPSPKRVAQVRDLVAEENVTCVLAEPLVNSGLIEAVAGTARVGVADPIGVNLTFDADLYENLLRSISQALVDCLGD